MSAIATKKSESKTGPDAILIYMGGIFVFAVILVIVFALIASIEVFSTNVMILVIYFLILSGLSFSMGSIIRENGMDEKMLKNWIYSMIAVSIIIGIVIGAYIW